MTLDQWLLVILGCAALYRYHRNELRKLEERFRECDKERIQLHNFFYAKDGASFTDVGNTSPAAAALEAPETDEQRYRERVDREKLRLKSLARRGRLSAIGPALRRIEQQGRPRFSKIRPPLDPETAAQVKEQVGRTFAEIGEQVKQKTNGRPTSDRG